MSTFERVDERAHGLMQPHQALAFIEARLGRPPRDGLEAAVVLEAWGGLRSEAALELGDRAMEVRPETEPEPPAPRPTRALEPISWIAEILGLLGFVAMATWGVPLGRALPNVNVDLAFKIGVPLALALQWGVRRRYFSGDRKLGSFGADGVTFLTLFMVMLIPIAACGPTGVLIAVLEVIWFSGYLLAKDRWGLVYVVGLAGTTWALYVHVPPEEILSVVAAVLFTTAVLRVVHHTKIRNRKTERTMPVSWLEIFPSMIIGASLGLMMVFSFTELRPNGWMLAAALVPAGAGSLVAAGIMRRLWFHLDRDLAASPGRTLDDAGARVVSHRLVIAGIAYFATCIALSCMVAPVLIDAGRTLVPTLELLGGFALFCRLTMMADFQHSWNRIAWSFVIAVPACATELGMSFYFTNAASALAIGAGVGLFISLFAQRMFVRHPAQVLATSVAIP